jgi:hypothetical protein
LSTGSDPTSPRFLWGLFCDHFLIDTGGKHSFIGVFERIGAPGFPVVHKVMWVVSSLRGEPNGAASAVVTVWTPDNNILISTAETPVRFSPEGRTILVHLLYDLNLPGAGTYTFVLEVGGRPLGRMELDVYQVALPGSPPPGGPPA